MENSESLAMPQWLHLPFIPYPQSKAGYWNPVTSTLNWCEEVCIYEYYYV
jgi:hypothetical protein